METITIQLTSEQCVALSKLLNSVSGMENARVLLPIYDAMKEALQRQAAHSGSIRGACSDGLVAHKPNKRDPASLEKR